MGKQSENTSKEDEMNNGDESPTTQDIDWRSRAVTSLEEDFLSPWTNQLHKKGTPVTLTTAVKHGDKPLYFGEPSAPALFLSQAFKAYTEAIRIQPYLANETPSSGAGTSAAIYDYLELIISSVIAAYTSLEAFANEEIPKEFIYEEQSEGGIIIARSKDWIEKHLSLDEKLATLLPKILEKKTPKGLKVWENYIQLRRLRHRIIHLKSADRTVSHIDNEFPKSIWSKLLKPKQENYPSIAKSMILYFQGMGQYHWLKYCPF
jgi:hypothetical protein